VLAIDGSGFPFVFLADAGVNMESMEPNDPYEGETYVSRAVSEVAHDGTTVPREPAVPEYRDAV